MPPVRVEYTQGENKSIGPKPRTFLGEVADGGRGIIVSDVTEQGESLLLISSDQSGLSGRVTRHAIETAPQTNRRSERAINPRNGELVSRIDDKSGEITVPFNGRVIGQGTLYLTHVNRY